MSDGGNEPGHSRVGPSALTSLGHPAPEGWLPIHTRALSEISSEAPGRRPTSRIMWMLWTGRGWACRLEAGDAQAAGCVRACLCPFVRYGSFYLEGRWLGGGWWIPESSCFH